MKNLSRLIAAALLAACTLPVFAVEIIHARRLPDGNVRELARLDLPARATHVREHSFLPAFAFAAPVIVAPAAAGGPTTPSLPAPALAQNFTSGTSNELDPADASGAVGRTHVVGAYNPGLVMHDRTGRVAASITLRQFFSVSARVGDQYDPRITYDAAYDRWILICVDRAKTMLFAVSKTGDPTGEWQRYDAGLTEAGIDFTRIALTRDTVMLMTAAGAGEVNDTSIILSVRKSELYGGANPLPVRKFKLFGDPGLVPVDAPSSTTEWVVSHRTFPDISVMRLESLSQTRLVAAPSWLRRGPFWVPQVSGPNLMSGYEHVESAIYRNGAIYAVFTAGTTFSSSNAAAWCRFDPETLEAKWDAVYDSAGRTHYSYPSIAVAGNGAVLIGMGAFSFDQHPAAALVFIDLLGRMTAPAIIRRGDSSFVANDRWGDYTATVSDPVDPRSLWTLQICTTDKETWGTVWARVQQAGPNRRHSVRH